MVWATGMKLCATTEKGENSMRCWSVGCITKVKVEWASAMRAVYPT